MTPIKDVAVIDVGSNSIRLVLYRVQGRAIWTVFNEKVLAGLGRDMPRTGRLAPEGVAAALGALRRFRAVLDGVRPHEILTAATAAVRDAADRLDFVGRVRGETAFVSVCCRERTRRASPPSASSPARRVPAAWWAISAAPASSWCG